ncbi:hypothetical protein [Lautropia mirabilis]|nr:hypothetical protein [Lautropia mirabilis]
MTKANSTLPSSSATPQAAYMYDKEPYVSQATEKMGQFFGKTL